MRVLIIIFCFFSLIAAKSQPAPTKESAVQFYKNHQFNQALVQFLLVLNQIPDDDEVRYYLSLSYAQKGMAQESAEVLAPLLQKDPSFYRYKVGFDPDFGPVRGKPVFKTMINKYDLQSIARDQTSNDMIITAPMGLTLLHRGIQIALHTPPMAHYQAQFLGKDYLYYTWFKQESEKDSHSGIRLYSRVRKEHEELYMGESPILKIYTPSIDRKTFFIYQIPHTFVVYFLEESSMRRLQSYEGSITHLDEKEGILHYRPIIKDKGRKKESDSSQIVYLKHLL